MKKIIIIIILTLSISTNAQIIKRIPGCIFKEQKSNAEFSIPKTRGISDALSSFSLKEYYPSVGDQGDYGTCTAWATTYASFTALNNIKNNKLGNSLKVEDCFSPQFTYDLIKRESDESCKDGSQIFTALDLLKRIGSIPLSEYPYNCNILNNGEGIERLKNNYADSLKFNQIISLANKNRLDDFIDLGKTNLSEKIKYSLNNKFPVVIGVSDFKNIETNLGKDTWIPEVVNYSPYGHAMSIVSYDDNKNGGSFEILNSWGEDWGNSGYCWVRYADLEKLIRRAYALTDMKPYAEKNKFYDFKLSIQLIGEDSKLFEYKNEKKIGYNGDEFYLGSIDNSDNKFIYPSEINKFQIGLSSDSNLYFYLLSMTSSSTVSVDYPISSKDNNLLDSKNSGLILPKNAQNYYDIKDFSNGWFSNSELLILFSTKKIDINEIIMAHKSEKFNNLNSFVRSVFQDNIVVSDLTIGNDEDFLSYLNNKMNITLINDNNYILPIIINLSEKVKPVKIVKPVTKKKHKK